MFAARYVIIGLSSSCFGSDEIILCHVRNKKSEDDSHFFMWILNANKGPTLKVSTEQSCIQITESTAEGLRIYTKLWRDNDTVWYFTQGVVVSMKEDGWIETGSANAVGKVVFDSSNILNCVLQTGNR